MSGYFDEGGMGLLRHDLNRRFAKYPNRSRWWKVQYVRHNPQYLTLIYYRLAKAAKGPHAALLNALYNASSRRTGLEILTPRLGGGLIMPHWGRILLNAETIGDNLYVFHNVTLGNDYRTGRPSIGNNVFIGAHAVVIGKVSIGDNTIIGAGSVVTKSVPPNSLVAGNPGKVIREIASDEIQKMIGY